MNLELVWSQPRLHPLRWLAEAGDASVEPPPPTALPAQFVNVPVGDAELEAAVDAALASFTGFTVRFDVLAPAGTWIIPHAFGRAPTAQVFLLSGEQIAADVLVDAVHITVVFASPTAGFVLAN